MQHRKSASKSIVPNVTPEEGWKLLFKELRAHRAVEVVATVSLNGKLAKALEGLVDHAVDIATQEHKPDVRLLRLIVRYAASTTRRMPGLNSPEGYDFATDQKLARK